MMVAQSARTEGSGSAPTPAQQQEMVQLLQMALQRAADAELDPQMVARIQAEFSEISVEHLRTPLPPVLVLQLLKGDIRHALRMAQNPYNMMRLKGMIMRKRRKEAARKEAALLAEAEARGQRPVPGAGMHPGVSGAPRQQMGQAGMVPQQAYGTSQQGMWQQQGMGYGQGGPMMMQGWQQQQQQQAMQLQQAGRAQQTPGQVGQVQGMPHHVQAQGNAFMGRPQQGIVRGAGAGNPQGGYGAVPSQQGNGSFLPGMPAYMHGMAQGAQNQGYAAARTDGQRVAGVSMPMSQAMMTHGQGGMYGMQHGMGQFAMGHVAPQAMAFQASAPLQMQQQQQQHVQPQHMQPQQRDAWQYSVPPPSLGADDNAATNYQSWIPAQPQGQDVQQQPQGDQQGGNDALRLRGGGSGGSPVLQPVCDDEVEIVRVRPIVIDGSGDAAQADTPRVKREDGAAAPSTPPAAAKSALNTLFTGQLLSSVECCCCGYTSTLTDVFNNLTLDIEPLIRSRVCEADDVAAEVQGGGAPAAAPTAPPSVDGDGVTPVPTAPVSAAGTPRADASKEQSLDQGDASAPPAPSGASGPPDTPGGGPGMGADALGMVAPPTAPGALGAEEAKRGKKKGGKGADGAGFKQATMKRCGQCQTCLNRHLKKGCLMNKAVREQMGPGTYAGSARATPAPSRGASAPVSPRGGGLIAAAAWHADSCAVGRRARGARPRVAPAPAGLDALGLHNGGAVCAGAPPAGKSGKPRSATAVAQQALPGFAQASSVGLRACLEHLTRPELMSDKKNVWTCPRCERPRPAVKQVTIRALPPVLVLHVKRFQHSWGSARGGRAWKLDTHVSFPERGLDVAPYLSCALPGAGMAPEEVRAVLGTSTPQVSQGVGAHSPGGSGSCSVSAAVGSDGVMHPPGLGATYDLGAVVCHSGTMEGGHYVCYVNEGGRWFRCDDAWIAEVSFEVVRASQAYLLFYHRRYI
ncbi:unnamed protein product [Pedinophyceae sp. YPF-701]|nr:unnamed protein product [Pedinophyceae sp. YPF-701]